MGIAVAGTAVDHCENSQGAGKGDVGEEVGRDDSELGGTAVSTSERSTESAPAAAPPTRAAILFGVTVVVALSVLLGWQGFRGYQAQQEASRRSQLLQAAREGAVNLTTIDWKRADADVQRIIDGATGEFYDDFLRRAEPFIAVVKKYRSVSVGSVSEAALESENGGPAQALVSVNVDTTNADESAQIPRAWRLRISVQRVGSDIKVSNVEFVP